MHRIPHQLAVVSLCALAASAHASELVEPSKSDRLRAVLQERLPNSQVDAIACDGLGGFCQITAGENIVYTDDKATVLFVGRVFDMKTGEDLTAKARQTHAGSLNATKVTPRIRWEDLPEDGAIVRNAGAKHRIAVFTDLNCGYCHRLNAEFASLQEVEVHEYLVGILNGTGKANAVWCAEDHTAALHAAYEQQPLPAISLDCDVSAISENSAFFFRKGFMGTPVIIRDDGAVIEGYRSADILKAWVAEGSKNHASE